MDDSLIVLNDDALGDSGALEENNASGADAAGSDSDGEQLETVLDGETVASDSDVGSTIIEFPSTMEISNLWERPIMSTSLNDYTVTEGLLLLIFLVLAVRAVFKIWNN